MDEDDTKRIYKLSRLSSPGIINIPDSNNQFEMNKFLESYCLGLIYIGTIKEKFKEFNMEYEKRPIEVELNEGFLGSTPLNGDNDISIPTINGYINLLYKK